MPFGRKHSGSTSSGCNTTSDARPVAKSFLACKLAKLQASARKKVTERELKNLNSKVDKLLNKIDRSELEPASSKIDQCITCCNAKATMQTLPCGHCAMCRKCFIRSIQAAVTERALPLRCIVCHKRVLQLGGTSAGALQMRLPLSVSQYSMMSSGGSSSGSHDWDLQSASSQHSISSDCSANSMNSGASKSSIRSSVSTTSSKKRVTFASSASQQKYRPTVTSPLVDGAGAAGSTEFTDLAVASNAEPTPQLLHRRGSISSKVSCLSESRLSPIRESRSERSSSRNGSSTSSSRCSSSISSSHSWRACARLSLAGDSSSAGSSRNGTSKRTAPLADDETRTLLSASDDSD